MVKGLAKHENRLRHVLRDKCVDASLFGEERLLPNDKNYFNRRVRVSALGRKRRSVKFSSVKNAVSTNPQLLWNPRGSSSGLEMTTNILRCSCQSQGIGFLVSQFNVSPSG